MYNNKRSVMGKWKRTLIAAALTASVILALPVWNVGRAEATETDETGNAPTDTPDAGNAQTDGKLDLSGKTKATLNIKRAGEKEHQGDIEVALYKVATAVPVPGYDAYTLSVKDTPYSSLSDDLKKALDQEEQETKGENALYRDLAQKAARIALGVAKTEDGKLTASPLETAKEPVPISKDAVGQFTNLDPGMYLVIAYGKDLTPDRYVGETSVKTTEEDGSEVTNTQLVTMAYSDGYVYRYLPELISLPSRGSAPVGSFSTASREPWSYSVNIELKSEVASEMASLRIMKAFNGVPENDRAALKGKEGCVYQIEAVLNGQTVYSNVVAVKYQGVATADSELLENVIPVGAEVTVTEVYDGAAFTVASGSNTTVTIQAEQGINYVPFTNTYNGNATGGGVVTNKFTPIQDQNGAVTYNWTNDDPAGQE